jgi:hypothetical protein
MTCALVLVAFGGQHKRNILRHVIIPVLGLAANIGMLIGIVIMSVSAGGTTQTDTLIALGIVGVWIVVGAAWIILSSAAKKTSLLVSPPAAVSPELQ